MDLCGFLAVHPRDIFHTNWVCLRRGGRGKGSGKNWKHIDPAGIPKYELQDQHPYLDTWHGCQVSKYPQKCGHDKLQKSWHKDMDMEKMNGQGFFLNPKMGSDLLLVAAGEKMGGYTTANDIWDLLQTRKINPSLLAVEAYHEGLKQREIPADDPWLLMVSRMLDNLRLGFGGRRNA
ncbi:putative TPR-like domain containing protein [Cocos nucifera]|uniref:Putative TPR-like domain containing protein n=1 Tax=Cocos nucifera TaxID=13894 RepID=A0A8K0IRC5_COCNU|nr:putative TPR-like domain containing protein [Cocos nucifera]